MIEDSRAISRRRITDSTVLTKRAADLLQIIVTHSTGTSNWKVYDGEDTSGELILDCKTPYTFTVDFPGGMYFRRGIYFHRDTKVQSATLRWRDRVDPEG